MTESNESSGTPEHSSSAWQTLKNHEDYEININYPHQIRKKSTGNIISENYDKDGYLTCGINRIPMKKHRLIAVQFIPNPENLTQIDHINNNRTDNRIEEIKEIKVLIKEDNILFLMNYQKQLKHLILIMVMI